MTCSKKSAELSKKIIESSSSNQAKRVFEKELSTCIIGTLITNWTKQRPEHQGVEKIYGIYYDSLFKHSSKDK
ncbi:hypothetical protein [Photobacterium kishitanii]|uniref:hypothetical protein n=1 Tax=Photobacterium kishitanii TaxID=318456 RepID=UPI000433BCE3|nr:hypothetical protein [Photobacterium kishitanii]CEO38542.1 hypothetical protein PPBDW_I20558 [Photobacterium kishitanii]